MAMEDLLMEARGHAVDLCHSPPEGETELEHPSTCEYGVLEAHEDVKVSFDLLLDRPLPGKVRDPRTRRKLWMRRIARTLAGRQKHIVESACAGLGGRDESQNCIYGVNLYTMAAMQLMGFSSNGGLYMKEALGGP